MNEMSETIIEKIYERSAQQDKVKEKREAGYDVYL